MFGFNSIVWEVSPELLQIGSIRIRWYGLLFAMAFVCGYQLLHWIYRREKKPVEDLDHLFLFMVVGTIIGARLGHCFFYRADYFLSHPLELLMIWRGGLASHGAAVGILLSLYLYSRWRKDQPYLWLLSRMGIAVALGGFFIRIGNLFNSEIVGKATEFSWGVVFVMRDENFARHPSQVYESLSYLLIFVILLRFYLSMKEQINSARLLGLFFCLVFGARFLIEYTKEIQAPFEQGLSLHMGQLLSIPMILLGIGLLIASRKPPA